MPCVLSSVHIGALARRLSVRFLTSVRVLLENLSKFGTSIAIDLRRQRISPHAWKVRPLKPHALVLCKSVHHGNTQKVANRIATELGALVVDPEHAMLPSAGALGLIGIGSGIYYGRFHKSVRNWLKSLPADAGEGHRAFVYSTSGLPFLSRIYHRPLRRGLEEKGFEVVGEFSCRGYDTYGLMCLIGGLNRTHPDEQDLLRAEQFATRLSHKFS